MLAATGVKSFLTSKLGMSLIAIVVFALYTYFVYDYTEEVVSVKKEQEFSKKLEKHNSFVRKKEIEIL